MLMMPLLPRAFAQHARSRGIDPAPIAAAVGLSLEALKGEDVPLPVTTVRAFLEALAEAANDPWFGLHAASQREAGSFGLLEFLLRHTGTMAELLERAGRYFRVVARAASLVPERTRDGVELTLRIPSPQMFGRQGNEFCVTTLVAIPRMLTRTRWSPERAWFAHPEPAERSPLVEYFGPGTRLEFDRPTCGVFFDPQMLATRLESADPVMGSFLEQQAKQLAESQPVGDDVLARVEAALRQNLQDGPGIEEIARRLHMSGRTLQRRLNANDTSFQDVLDRIRKEQAQRLLEDPARPLAEIAYRLGYSDVSPFLRAFKRWTGRTPRATR